MPPREPPVTVKPCPICGKPPAERYRPFCSARCADIDLNRWLSGRYVIPDEADPEPETPAEPPQDAPDED